MLTLLAKIRKTTGRKVKTLRKQGVLPAVLYGPKVRSQPLVVNLKEFEKVYREAGESTLIKLKIEDSKAENKEFQVLIHDVQKNPLTEIPIHADFYQPRLEEEVEATVPLVFEGEAPGVKELGGVLVKNISEIEVRALPQNLPKEIKVDVSVLKTFEDNIQIKDLELPSGVQVLKEPEEVIALITPPEKEELAEKPSEEEVEEEEKVEEKREGGEK